MTNEKWRMKNEKLWWGRKAIPPVVARIFLGDRSSPLTREASLVQGEYGGVAIPPSWRQKSLVNKKGRYIASKTQQRNSLSLAVNPPPFDKGGKGVDDFWGIVRFWKMVGKAVSPLLKRAKFDVCSLCVVVMNCKNIRRGVGLPLPLHQCLQFSECFKTIKYQG